MGCFVWRKRTKIFSKPHSAKTCRWISYKEEFSYVNRDFCVYSLVYACRLFKQKFLQNNCAVKCCIVDIIVVSFCLKMYRSAFDGWSLPAPASGGSRGDIRPCPPIRPCPHPVRQSGRKLWVWYNKKKCIHCGQLILRKISVTLVPHDVTF